MKDKKNSADWYIAATHWLTAGFVVPFLMTLVAGVLVGMFLGNANLALLMVVFGAIHIISIWFGVMYSAKYLDKTYVLKNAHKIAVISTVYLAVIGFGFRIFQFLQGGTISYELVQIIAGVIVFYIASKKYIKNNTASV